MKMPFRFIGVIMFLFLGWLVGVGLTKAQGNQGSSTLSQTASQANLPWSIQYIQQELDPPRDVGGYVSMALLPFNNFLAISFYDATHHSLMAATPWPNHAGNCGTNNNWACVTVDDGGGLPVGMYTSIDMWGFSVNNWKMGISYYDIFNRALKAAIYTCVSGSCAWNIVTVSAPDSVNESIGLYSSFKFDSTGNAGIAFFSLNTTYLNSVLMYVYQVPGGGDCGEGPSTGLWECDEAIILGGEGKYASLDFNYDDVPYIAYYAADEGDLGLAIKGGLCGPELGWSCLLLDGAGADVGLYASLIAPKYAGDLYRVAYHDKTNGHLKYYDPEWGPVVVDEMGTSISPMGISMIMDDEDYPVIAYQKITSDFSPPELSIARPYNVFGDEPYGNCGDNPPGYIFAYWFCSTLDNGGQYTEEADFASITINSRGMLGIAYTEYDSYYDVTSLKFAYQTLFHTFMPVTTR